MDVPVQDFLNKTHSAAMVTIASDGSPHAVRVGIALVEGKLWSSGTQDRLRTAHLRRDNRCTLFVFGAAGPASWSYLTLKTTVTILEGPEVGPGSLLLFRIMQGLTDSSAPITWNGRPMSDEQVLEAMSDERRLIYQFEVADSYGVF